MGKEDLMPSESEWKIMEVLWDSVEPLTTSEIRERLNGESAMTLKMLRVLMNRLLQKGLVDYEVDERDSRVYHYHATKSREECVREKSKRFVDSYFAGSRTSALAALLQTCELTDEQIRELEDIIENSKGSDESCRK